MRKAAEIAEDWKGNDIDFECVPCLAQDITAARLEVVAELRRMAETVLTVTGGGRVDCVNCTGHAMAATLYDVANKLEATIRAADETDKEPGT